jgi:hypothetical protein
VSGSMSSPDRGRLDWALLALSAVALSLLAQLLPRELLQWERARAWIEPWRWWTAGFVHHGPAHLWMNIAACVVTGLFGHRAAQACGEDKDKDEDKAAAARLARRWAGCWLLAWPLTHLGLLAWPQLDPLAHYGGLSGVLHAGVGVVCVGLLVNARTRWPRLVGALVLAGLAAKIVLEEPLGPAVRPLPGWEVGVVPLAHATGALAGLIVALLAEGLARRRRPGTTMAG